MKTASTYKENSFKLINVRDEIVNFLWMGWDGTMGLFMLRFTLKIGITRQGIRLLGLISSFISQNSASDLIVDLCLFPTKQSRSRQNSLLKAHLYN